MLWYPVREVFLKFWYEFWWFCISVGAHVANPCGHTCCGICLSTWIASNVRISASPVRIPFLLLPQKSTAVCPVCRTKLTRSIPMIRNMAMDAVVDKHIRTLADNGSTDWQDGGTRLVDFKARETSVLHLLSQSEEMTFSCWTVHGITRIEGNVMFENLSKSREEHRSLLIYLQTMTGLYLMIWMMRKRHRPCDGRLVRTHRHIQWCLSIQWNLPKYVH